ncbi:hypothetical protein D3C81_1272690 [compost metagenome]
MLDNILSSSHKHTESGWSAIPDCYFIVLNRIIPIAWRKSSTTNDVGHSMKPWSKYAIRCTRYPTRISGTPIYIIFLKIKNNLTCIVVLQHRIMHMVYTFWFASGTRSIVQNQAILTVHPFNFTLSGGFSHFSMIIDNTF